MNQHFAERRLHDNTASRRDVLWLATGLAGVSSLPFLARLPIAPMDYVDVDMIALEPGASITVNWNGERVTVRRRTQREIEAARTVALDALKDPQADELRVKPGRDEWLVVIAKCTHKGCIPVNEVGDYGGWFCPCHGSTYDTSGRVRSGPAPRNLVIPPYEFLDSTFIRIG